MYLCVVTRMHISLSLSIYIYMYTYVDAFAYVYPYVYSSRVSFLGPDVSDGQNIGLAASSIPASSSRGGRARNVTWAHEAFVGLGPPPNMASVFRVSGTLSLNQKGEPAPKTEDHCTDVAAVGLLVEPLAQGAGLLHVVPNKNEAPDRISFQLGVRQATIKTVV